MPIRLVPLTLAHLKGLAADPTEVDGMPVAAGSLPPSRVLERAGTALESGAEPVWHVPFLFLETEKEKIVGCGGFKGVPNDGRVEIGYGVGDEHRSRGIATHAVRQLAAIAFLHAPVREVFAEASVSNPASNRVLEKAGFQKIGQRDTADDEDGLVDQWLLRREHGQIPPTSPPATE